MKGFGNDMEFLSALQAKSAEAFDQLYAVYYRPLCYFAESLIGDANAAQDVVTESFIKLLKVTSAFDSTKNVKSFLYSITRNACFDHLRAIKRHKGSLEKMHYLRGEQNEFAEPQIIRAEILQAIYRAIERLPEKYKGPVSLALLEDKRNEEIAQELGIAPQTVRNRKSEGYKLLRIALNHQHGLSPLIISYLFTQFQ